MIIQREDWLLHDGFLPMVSKNASMINNDTFDYFQLLSEPWLEYRRLNGYGIWLSYKIQAENHMDLQTVLSIPLLLFSTPPHISLEMRDDTWMHINERSVSVCYYFYDKRKKHANEYIFNRSDIKFANKYVFGVSWIDVLSSINMKPQII